MSVNILELTKNYFTPQVVEGISEFTGEHPNYVKSAMGSIFPVLLGGIMNKASTTGGVQKIMALLNDQTNLSVLNTLPSFFGDKTKMQDLLTAGAKLLPILLGNKLGSVTDSIASVNGLKNSSASSLLSLATPILLSVIGKQFTSSGLGVSGLASMLMGQKNAVLAALPAGLAGLMNFSDLGDFKGNESNSYQRKEMNEKGSGIGKWWPWLLGGLILFAIVWGLKNCQNQKVEVIDDTTVSVDSAAGSASDLTDTISSKIETGLDKLGAFFSKKLPNGIELNIPALGIENNLISFIQDANKPADKTTWFNFDRIIFETGSTKLSAESLEQTKNIAEILKAFPAVTLKIGGYTDSTGDTAANLKLSQGRANAVKEAIVSEGIEAGRLEAEGYGNEHPVASNDDEAGRAQNRRIALRVTAK